MKKLLLIIFLFAGLFINAAAQDVIRTKDGRTIEARITEVGTSTISYKRYSNPNGPTFTLPISQIQSIEYENGERDIFANASQVYTKKKYKELKGKYNPRRYKSHSGDPYSPFLSGLGSFLIPGLGQAFDGEFGRGLLVWLGNGAMTVGTYATLVPWYVNYVEWLDSQGVSTTDGYVDTSNLDYSTAPSVPKSFFVMLAADVVYYIWNIKDARKIAKVKNMYYQDCHGNLAAMDLGFEPYFAFSPAPTGLQPVTGVSLKLTF